MLDCIPFLELAVPQSVKVDSMLLDPTPTLSLWHDTLTDMSMLVLHFTPRATLNQQVAQLQNAQALTGVDHVLTF